MNSTTSANSGSTALAFKDQTIVQTLAKNITSLANQLAELKKRPLQIMEVCGGHTHAIYRFGLDQLLPDTLEFVHGPGCPVCVLPPEAVDNAIALAQQPNTILASFGDTLRVPGSANSLLQAKALGADVRVLYSPMDALQLATQHPDKRIIFFAIGFDTTMPGIAYSIQQAYQQQIPNLFFYCHHIRLLPTLEGLFLQPNPVKLDGLIGPGHVSMVIGSKVYEDFVTKTDLPLVIAGFEPVDLLDALYQILLQIEQGESRVENRYTRVVQEQGNQAALKSIHEVFDMDIDANWRGLGEVSGSGVHIKDKYRAYDAQQFINKEEANKHSETQLEPIYCQQVMTGQLRPTQCPKFNSECIPEHPLGALMVSSEGACAAYYQYKIRA
ncbi:hydrogenase formation protein HypD [Paraneptunicella aestuarii]|uniref:hydrogenase formation protein HypD n=1 Tax=Paraneptunicella aestuarii TaxID=2831148 RepID=UPI001E51E84A|nr:hydrogenase formation protein HypD [Paraneptunicella aestuarii]UAA40584.1 hydrogenase formation protein HypD [Paraneptunicella aestuarii]